MVTPPGAPPAWVVGCTPGGTAVCSKPPRRIRQRRCIVRGAGYKLVARPLTASDLCCTLGPCHSCSHAPHAHTGAGQQLAAGPSCVGSCHAHIDEGPLACRAHWRVLCSWHRHHYLSQPIFWPLLIPCTVWHAHGCGQEEAGRAEGQSAAASPGSMGSPLRLSEQSWPYQPG